MSKLETGNHPKGFATAAEARKSEEDLAAAIVAAQYEPLARALSPQDDSRQMDLVLKG